RDIEHALLSLLEEERLQLGPDRARPLRRPRKEFLVVVIRVDILLHEIPDVDFLEPEPGRERVPRTAPGLVPWPFGNLNAHVSSSRTKRPLVGPCAVTLPACRRYGLRPSAPRGRSRAGTGPTRSQRPRRKRWARRWSDSVRARVCRRCSRLQAGSRRQARAAPK